jgi:hypothetical protein
MVAAASNQNRRLRKTIKVFRQPVPVEFNESHLERSECCYPLYYPLSVLLPSFSPFRSAVFPEAFEFFLPVQPDKAASKNPALQILRNSVR